MMLEQVQISSASKIVLTIATAITLSILMLPTISASLPFTELGSQQLQEETRFCVELENQRDGSVRKVSRECGSVAMK